VEAGYPPELAYFECLHELKFIVDLMHEQGISGMRSRISTTAKWGDVTVGPKIVDATVQKRMSAALRDVRSGKFAKEWIRETNGGQKRYRELLRAAERHPIEKVGKRLRGLMAWEK
jgi:ketol-acid reductoisomerase